MKTACCENKASALSQLRLRRAGVVRIAFVLNLTMFVVEFAAGLLSGSTALLADSLDMLGDAAAYAAILYAMGRGGAWGLRAAWLKAGVMGCFGGLALAHIILRAMTGEPPHSEAMGMIGAMALGVNMLCLALLWSHRTADLNMRSVWLCSRNDVISNLSVLLAAWLVWLTGSAWPDLLIGSMVCGVFAHSALVVGREALKELRRHRLRSFIPPCCDLFQGLMISRRPESALIAGCSR